jgi:hypothetical protein
MVGSQLRFKFDDFSSDSFLDLQDIIISKILDIIIKYGL